MTTDMMDEEIRTIPLALESIANGITVSIPWAQRQPNGAVIVRVHMQSPKHQAGELLLNETDLIALDPDERPLRTQVRRFWGYTALGDVTAAHLQTARFDVGFRLDLVASGGRCGLAIAIIRTFRPGEGPKVTGGPWVFTFQVVDEKELAALARADAARLETARREAAQREQVQREASERDAAQRETARLARVRADAERGGPNRADRLPQTAQPSLYESRRDQQEGLMRSDRGDADGYPTGSGRGRRPSRFARPDRGDRDEIRREPLQTVQPAEVDHQSQDQTPAAPSSEPRVRGPRGASAATRRVIEDAVMGPAETALEAVGERPQKQGNEDQDVPVIDEPVAKGIDAATPEKPASRPRAARPAVRKAPRASAPKRGGEGDAPATGSSAAEDV